MKKLSFLLMYVLLVIVVTGVAHAQRRGGDNSGWQPWYSGPGNNFAGWNYKKQVGGWFINGTMESKFASWSGDYRLDGDEEAEMVSAKELVTSFQKARAGMQEKDIEEILGSPSERRKGGAEVFYDFYSTKYGSKSHCEILAVFNRYKRLKAIYIYVYTHEGRQAAKGQLYDLGGSQDRGGIVW